MYSATVSEDSMHLLPIQRQIKRHLQDGERMSCGGIPARPWRVRGWLSLEWAYHPDDGIPEEQPPRLIPLNDGSALHLVILSDAQLPNIVRGAYQYQRKDPPAEASGSILLRFLFQCCPPRSRLATSFAWPLRYDLPVLLTVLFPPTTIMARLMLASSFNNLLTLVQKRDGVHLVLPQDAITASVRLHLWCCTSLGRCRVLRGRQDKQRVQTVGVVRTEVVSGGMK